jgi:protein-S-isoprenylcysteine O-methyltransferase Ste14
MIWALASLHSLWPTWTTDLGFAAQQEDSGSLLTTSVDTYPGVAAHQRRGATRRLGFLANALWAILFLPVTLLVMRHTAIEREEHFLEGELGEEYLRYKARVHRWI